MVASLLNLSIGHGFDP